MIPRGLAKRYATALLNAALKANIAGEVHEDAKGFRQVFAANTPFKNFLLSPQVLTEDKKDVLNSTLDGRTSRLFLEFLLLLIDKKRFPFIEEIIEAYGQLYETHQGVLEVRVISAVPLDSRFEKKIIDKIENETGKMVRLVKAIDPTIIGGLIVIMEDKIMDGSLRFQLEKLKRELDEIRV